MTSPQPDTETILARANSSLTPWTQLRTDVLWLAARLAETEAALRTAEAAMLEDLRLKHKTEAQRDEVLRNIQDERVQAQLAKDREAKAWAQIATLEAIVALVVQSKFGEAQEQAHAYFQPEVEQRLAAALDSLPSQKENT